MKPRVYWVDMRARREKEALIHKIARLWDKAGMSNVISDGDIAAVKMHFGALGNETHLRPQHVRVVVDKVKESGGIPFVTETTGIGLNKAMGTATSYLKLATSHGLTSETVGAPIIIADGLKGFSGIHVRVNGRRLDGVEVAQAIAEADALISAAHFKGHPQTGIGGAIKNVGMGGLSKCGKAPLHLAKKPQVKAEECDGCGVCVPFCPVGAIKPRGEKVVIDQDLCIWACGCWDICPRQAITTWDEMQFPDTRELDIRLVDSFAAITGHIGKDKCGFLNFLYGITAHCDCFEFSDAPMVPDIGVLASKDPVAIDQASADLVNRMPGIPGTVAEDLDFLEKEKDKFTDLGRAYSKTWQSSDYNPLLEAAEKMGLGIRKYELIKVE